MALTDQIQNEKTFDESASGEYNPLLSAAPVKKEYQKANIDPTSVPTHIPEQQFTKPVIKFDENAEQAEISNASETKPKEPLNPSVNDLSKSEKRAGAMLVADQAISAYGFVCNKIFVPFASVNEKKLNEMIAEGEIDPNIKFQVDASGKTATPRIFAQEWNETVQENLAMDEDFVERVREPLIRICEKRGFALTDEQYLGIEIGKDLITRTAIAWDLKKSAGMILEQLKANTIAIKMQHQPQPTPPTPSPVSPLNNETTEPIIVASSEVVKENVVNDLLQNPIEEVPKSGNFVARQEVSGMPEFGNRSILEHMAAEAENDNPKKTTSRTTSSRTRTSPKTKSSKNQKPAAKK